MELMQLTLGLVIVLEQGCLQYTTQRGSKYISVEANQSFIDDNGASEIINNLFGYPTGVAVSEARFFLYGVANDDQDTIQFMISPVSHLRTSPAAAAIGAPDDAVADDITDRRNSL
jgi:hypothetical protein